MGQKEKLTEAHRKELMGKLESIIKILNDKVEADSTIPTLQETIDLSMLTKDEYAQTSSSFDVSKTDSSPSDSISQQSLFQEPTPHEKGVATPAGNHTKIEKAPSAKMENPFLPRHIRARLYHEEQDIQSLESSVSRDRSDIDSSKDLHDSIIDNLIAFYLPKIEADLRRRLKALAAKETHEKKAINHFIASSYPVVDY